MFTLGFDVGKDHVDVAFINKAGQLKQRYKVANTVLDITKLLEEVKSKHLKLAIGCEATGYYHLMTVQACRQSQLPCYVLNPLMTKQYTKSTVRGRKTDNDDAVSIARLVLRGEGSLVTSEHVIAQTYMRLATKITQTRQALGLQERFYLELHKTLGIETKTPFTESLGALEDLVATLRQQAEVLINSQERDLLVSIVGIGPMIANTILAEIGSINRFSGPKQLVAYTGLDPRIRQSGQVLNQHTKLTKRGAPELRRVLFLAANIARQHDVEMRAYYHKKRSEGKSYTAATVATSRKLTYRIYAVLKRGTPYIKSA